jgi:small-conductance mechanosensitive channel
MAEASSKKRINWVKILFWVSVIVIAALMYYGVFDNVKAFLNDKSLKIKLGTLSFTPYKLLKAFVIFIIALWVSGRLSSFIEKALRRSNSVSPASRALTVKILNILFYAISGLIGLHVLGIDVTTITVFGGAIGIGIGFGLQKIASNFISGIIMLFERSINEGDLVELQGGGSGFVRRISGRYTLVEDYNGKEIMIPNEDFISSRVTNFTLSNRLGRLDIQIGVSYDSDIHKAQRIILDAARNHPLCSKDKAPDCYLREFGDSAVIFLLQMWLDDVTEGRFDATNDILFEVWDKFKSEGIGIPYPQLEVHVKDNNAKV